MEDETIKNLEKKRRKRMVRNFEIMIIILIILGAMNSIFLIAFSIILMLIGVSMMYNIGDSITGLRAGFSLLNVEMDKTEESDRGWYMGAIMSVIGFLLFIFTLYLMSIGWEGLLSI